MKSISILGSTGSIGKQTLEVIEVLEEDFKVLALTANSSIDLLAAQVKKFHPEYVVLMNESLVSELKYKLSNTNVKILTGMEGLIEVVTLAELDLVVNAVVGAVGVQPTLAAIKAKKDIALANKETLVTAGEIVMREVARHGVKILPIDSEHNAIFQALEGQERSELKKIILTASGGPFRDTSLDKLATVSVNEALDHPNWDMGGKITIDSATLMNKGLEVIEAKWLFDLDYNQIDVVVHPQSIIHSLVEYQDTSILAELGLPDMKVPIQYALTYPHRQANQLESLDLAKVGELSFEEPRKDAFPCLEYAYEAGKRGGTMPAVLNAANEVAVHKFLNNKIKFLDISKLIERVMSKHQVVNNPQLEDILEADAWARRVTDKEGEEMC